MITTTKITDLTNEPPKVNKKDPPQSTNKNLTPLYHTVMMVGAKNSGKSYGVVRWLKNYEENPIYNKDGIKLKQKIILFCPTASSDANPIYSTLKNLDPDDIILDYSDEKLQEKLDEIEALKIEIEKYKAYKKAYNSFLKKSVKNLTEEELVILYELDFVEPDEIKPEYENMPVYWMILDDLIGDNKCFKKGASTITNLTIKHRHLGINLIFTSQYIKAIPPTIRRNIDVYVLYKFANKKAIIEQIQPEISSLCTEKEFEELYTFATEPDYSSLVIDNHPRTPKNERFKMNFDIILNRTNTNNQISSETLVE